MRVPFWRVPFGHFQFSRDFRGLGKDGKSFCFFLPAFSHEANKDRKIREGPPPYQTHHAIVNFWVHTKGVMQQHAILRRVLRSLSETRDDHKN